MINYIMNQNSKKNSSKNTNISFKYSKNKKNSFTNINSSKKINFNNNQSSKNKKENFLKINSPNNEKIQIKYTKKLINELFKRREISPEETKIKFKHNKTNTNSPMRKITFNRYPSLKKINQVKNENIRLSLFNNNKEDYIKFNHIKKNIFKHNISLSNNTNISNNNITTNFTNSVNNTVASITNNNSIIKSYKKNKKIKSNQRKEIKINIKILYKDIFYNIELNQYNNGLWLSKKINEYFNICLNEKQIHLLAQELTNQINNIINYIITNSTNINNFGAVIDINKILKENKINNNDKRYKIVVKYNNENYYFFVKNKNEDINDMTNIIVNNIIKTEKYDSSALRDEIIRKIKGSFDKMYNKNGSITGTKNNNDK